MPRERVSWENYFMNIAHEVSTRSTCNRKHVGAVVVRNKTILSTGYNGSIKGLPHCDEVGCEMVDGHCIRTTHAEANAILKVAHGLTQKCKCRVKMTLSAKHMDLQGFHMDFIPASKNPKGQAYPTK